MVRMLEAIVPYANTIIVFFTIVLVVTTVIYTWVTSKLLRQTKNAFLADMIVRFMEIHLGELKETYLGKDKIEGTERFMKETLIKAYIGAICGAFGMIDRKLGKKIDKIMGVGLKKGQRAVDDALKELDKDKKIVKRDEGL